MLLVRHSAFFHSPSAPTQLCTCPGLWKAAHARSHCEFCVSICVSGSAAKTSIRVFSCERHQQTLESVSLASTTRTLCSKGRLRLRIRFNGLSLAPELNASNSPSRYMHSGSLSYCLRLGVAVFSLPVSGCLSAEVPRWHGTARMTNLRRAVRPETVCSMVGGASSRGEFSARRRIQCTLGCSRSGRDDQITWISWWRSQRQYVTVGRRLKPHVVGSNRELIR